MIISFNNTKITPSNFSKQIQEGHLIYDHPDSLVKQVDLVMQSSGIVKEHLLRLPQIASDLNCIISIRPVDKLATELIESGHPTKGFAIKGKSASWGPQAGFICVEQGFSKLENEPEEVIKKYNKQVHQCITEGHAAAVPLVLTRSRLYTLLEKSIINNLSLDNAVGVRHFISKSPSGEIYNFTATQLPAPDDSQYVISYGDKPVEVLAPDAASLAFTADYDLLMIAPHVSDLGPQDNLPIPDISHNIFRQRIEIYRKKPVENQKLMKDYADPAHFYLRESPEIGNASERIRQLIPYINQQLVGDGEKVIHHNMDATSPVSDTSANYPATFAFPVNIGRFGCLTIIKNSDELNELIFEVINAGYFIKTNPLWDPEIPKTLSPKFVSARKSLAFSFKSFA